MNESIDYTGTYKMNRIRNDYHRPGETHSKGQFRDNF